MKCGINKYNNMRERIRRIIEDSIGVDIDEYPKDTRFEYDLGCDSLDMVDIIMKIEREFNISIPDNDIPNINTIQELIDYVTKRCN